MQIVSITPTLPATDLDRALGFYEGKLGLSVVERDECEALLAAGDDRVLLFERDGPSKADNTAASFQVDDLAKAMAELRGRGVTFHDYDTPGLTTVDGVYDDGECLTAWADDTEGNTLCFCTVRRAKVKVPA